MSTVSVNSAAVALLILTMALLRYTLWARGKGAESGTAIGIVIALVVFAAFALRNVTKNARQDLRGLLRFLCIIIFVAGVNVL